MNPTPSMTVRKFVDDFYAIERPIGHKQVLQLRDMVRVLTVFVGHDITLAELDENIVSRWTAWMEDQNYAAETCKSKQRMLLAVWRYAADFDVVPEPRKRRIRKVRKATPMTTCWTLAEIEKLLAAVDTAFGPHNYAGMCANTSQAWWEKNVVGHRYRNIDPRAFWTAFIRTAFDSGLRLSDVLAMRREDIDFDTGVLVMQQQKTGQPIVCTLTPETLAAIDATYPPDREFVFPWAKNWRQKFHLRFRTLVDAAGIRKGTTKWLRRSRATYAEKDAPGMARRVLGHSSSDTWKRYFDVRIGTTAPPAAPKLSPERHQPKRIKGPTLLIEGPKPDKPTEDVA
jgi:integrase